MPIMDQGSHQAKAPVTFTRLIGYWFKLVLFASPAFIACWVLQDTGLTHALADLLVPPAQATATHPEISMAKYVRGGQVEAVAENIRFVGGGFFTWAVALMVGVLALRKFVAWWTDSLSKTIDAALGAAHSAIERKVKQ